MPLNINNLTAGTPVTFNAQTSPQRMVFDSENIAFRIVNNTTGIVTVSEENSDGFICQVNPGATAFGLMQNAILVKAQYPGSVTLTPYSWVPVTFAQGTFLPTVTGTGVNPTFSGYVTRFGKWTKIGNRVIIDVFVVTNVVTAVGDGFLQVSNLPFTPDRSIRTVGAMQTPLGGTVANAPTLRPVIMETGLGHTGVVFTYLDDNTDMAFFPLGVEPFGEGSNFEITFHIEYFV